MQGEAMGERVLKMRKDAGQRFLADERFREFMWTLARLESQRTGKPVSIRAHNGMRLRSSK
jgi:hypothetical protein